MWYQGAMVEEDEDRDLEKLYPQIYFKVMPLVMHHCGHLESKYGVMYCPTKRELSDISDDIYNRLNEGMGNTVGEETRQFGGGGFLGDLASILLLRELSRRRRRRRRPYYY
jgi:hypothetical protein